MYKVWATNDVPSAADFNNLFADPVQADVAAQEATTSSTYGDLTTLGPSVTMSLVNGQTAQVTVESRIFNSVSGNPSYATFAVTGAGTLAADDDNAAESASDTNGRSRQTRHTVFTAGATGSFTFRMKYRVLSGTGSFGNRRLTVKKG